MVHVPEVHRVCVLAVGAAEHGSRASQRVNRACGSTLPRTSTVLYARRVVFRLHRGWPSERAWTEDKRDPNRRGPPASTRTQACGRQDDLLAGGRDSLSSASGVWSCVGVTVFHRPDRGYCPGCGLTTCSQRCCLVKWPEVSSVFVLRVLPLHIPPRCAGGGPQ